MRNLLVSLAVGAMLALTAGTSPALAQARGDQREVRKEMRAGNVQSLREIEKRVLPRMRGMQYLGPEYDAATMAYRLKFIDNGYVVFVDVDARSGQVLRNSAASYTPQR